MVAARSDRRFDRRSRGHSQGDGLRHHRGSAPGGAVHGVRADGHLCRTGDVPAAHFVKGTFFHNVIAIVAHLSHTSAATLVLALALLALIFGLEHLAPNAPTPLIAMGGAIAASALLGSRSWGSRRWEASRADFRRSHGRTSIWSRRCGRARPASP